MIGFLGFVSVALCFWNLYGFVWELVSFDDKRIPFDAMVKLGMLSMAGLVLVVASPHGLGSVLVIALQLYTIDTVSKYRGTRFGRRV